jgi:hypothetical protein
MASKTVGMSSQVPVPEAARFKPAPKKKLSDADSSETAPTLAVIRDSSETAPTLVVSALSSSKSFEPIIAKVKNGVAYVVGRIGETLVYVETNVSEACGPTKVWVLGKIAGAQAHLQVVLDPCVHHATEIYEAVVAKVDAAYGSIRNKAITIASPVHAKVVGGVLYIQGAIGNVRICVHAKASETWSAAVSRASGVYVIAHQAADSRLRPVWMSTLSKTILAKEYVQAAVQPFWIRANDGCVFIQTSVGNTLVRIKVGVVDVKDRVSAQVMASYASMYGAVNSYTAPLLARIVSLYGSVKAQTLRLLEPFFNKARSMGEYFMTSVNGIAVGVKVKAASLRDIALEYQSICYIRFKDGFIYARGLVGDKVFCIKVSLEELVSGLRVKLAAIHSGAHARVCAAKGRIQDVACSATQATRSKTSELGTKVCIAVKDRGMQVTAASAVGGAAAMGASGGAAGLTTGAVIGAACGVVPAFFTFGLSIPIGAALGGATGLCAGTVAGGTAGLVGGGLAGRSAHNNQDAIQNRMKGSKDFMAEKTKGYKDFVVGKSADLRTRLVGGTGGSF